MDEFVNSLDISRFEQTNGIWNELMLNDPWSVGYVSSLIEAQEFKCKEDWEIFYYSSGNQRNAEISKLTREQQALLNNEQLVLTGKNQIETLAFHLKILNYNYGRTMPQIAQKGRILFQYALKKGIDITEEECIEAVRFRTICQTWNGIAIRERKALCFLKQQFPGLSFQKTSGGYDYEFAVDYEVFNQHRLICGIQIKPASYEKSQAPYVCAARTANKRKNEKYTAMSGVPVYTIYYDKGEIRNCHVLDEIHRLI